MSARGGGVGAPEPELPRAPGLRWSACWRASLNSLVKNSSSSRPAESSSGMFAPGSSPLPFAPGEVARVHPRGALLPLHSELRRKRLAVTPMPARTALGPPVQSAIRYLPRRLSAHFGLGRTAVPHLTPSFSQSFGFTT